MAKLYYYYGVMGCGKTLKLLSTAYNFEENNIHFLLMKPSVDTRDGEGKIKSRIGLEKECIPITPTMNVFDVIREGNDMLSLSMNKLEWVLIDECQFLTEEQIDQIAHIVDMLDINVMCYGLRTDFQSKSFPASKRLFELADDIEEMKARCSCGRKASINARFSKDGEIITEGEQILVGGDDIYKPICRKCWTEKIIDKKFKKV